MAFFEQKVEVTVGSMLQAFFVHKVSWNTRNEIEIVSQWNGRIWCRVWKSWNCNCHINVLCGAFSYKKNAFWEKKNQTSVISIWAQAPLFEFRHAHTLVMDNWKSNTVSLIWQAIISAGKCNTHQSYACLECDMLLVFSKCFHDVFSPIKQQILPLQLWNLTADVMT